MPLSQFFVPICDWADRRRVMSSSVALSAAGNFDDILRGVCPKFRPGVVPSVKYVLQGICRTEYD
jgi:hypothetical protein